MRVVFFPLLLMITVVLAQSQEPAAKQTGVLRLRVRVQLDNVPKPKPLTRKRFFLIPGTLEQNRTLLEAIDRQPLATRDCYYTKLGASPELIKWLKTSDCESVYCRGVERSFVTGPEAVPEFAKAFTESLKEFQNEETARRWLTTNLNPDLRDGFYRERQRALQALLTQARAVQSVMTDANGTAYFTGLEPGTYVVSNLIPTELGQTLLTWNCQVEVKAGDLATETPFQISNRKANQVRCVAVEKPMPVCNTN